MEDTFKSALSRIKADDELKKRTAEFVLSSDSNIVSINSKAALRKKRIFIKRFVAAACIAAVLCALPVGAYAYYKTPTSYVSVDINPSVELGINAFGKVVSVKALNPEGEEVLAGLSLVNSNVENAVRLVVKSAAVSGFIKDDGSSFITVTAETNNAKKAEKLKAEAQAGAEDAIESEDDTATIQADNIALERRDEAFKLGITPGKLNLMQKVQELDPKLQELDMEALAAVFENSTVSEIQQQFIELKKAQNGSGKKTEEQTTTGETDSQATVSPAGNNQKPGQSNGNNGNGSNKHDNQTSTSGIDADSNPSNTLTPTQNGNANHNKNGKDGDDG